MWTDSGRGQSISPLIRVIVSPVETKYGGMDISAVKRLLELEREYADL